MFNAAQIANVVNQINLYQHQHFMLTWDVRDIDLFADRRVRLQLEAFSVHKYEKIAFVALAAVTAVALTIGILRIVYAESAPALGWFKWVKIPASQNLVIGKLACGVSGFLIGGMVVRALWLLKNKRTIDRENERKIRLQNAENQCRQLCDAIRGGDLNQVKALATHENVNRFLVEADDDITLLQYAAAKGNLSIVKHLTENQLDAGEGTHWRGTLSYAVLGGNLDVLTYLVEERKEGITDIKLDGALYYASLLGKKECVDYLLTQGADATRCFMLEDRHDHACLVNDDETLTTLLAASFDPSIAANRYILHPGAGISDTAALQRAQELAGPALSLQSAILIKELSLILQDVQAEVFSYFHIALNPKDPRFSPVETPFLEIYRKVPLEIQMHISKDVARTCVSALIGSSERPDGAKWIWRSAREREDLLRFIPLLRSQNEAVAFIRSGNFPDPSVSAIELHITKNRKDFLFP